MQKEKRRDVKRDIVIGKNLIKQLKSIVAKIHNLKASFSATDLFNKFEISYNPVHYANNNFQS